MKRINFLETSAPSKITFQFNYFFILLLFCLLLIVSIAFSWVQKARIVSATESYQEAVSQVALLKAQQADSKGNSKSDHIDLQLLNKPVAWSRLLEDIFAVVPSAVILENIGGSSVGDSKLSIVGNAYEVYPILDFQRALRSFSWCPQADLTTLAQPVTQSANVAISFELECRLP